MRHVVAVIDEIDEIDREIAGIGDFGAPDPVF
jgi:hypothetical protein